LLSPHPRLLHPAVALLVSVLAALSVAPAGAEPAGPADERADAADARADAGGFVWRPSISLTPMYDDNIYALPAQEIADWIWVVSPALSGESRWDSHRLSIDAGAELGRYDEYGTEDYDDWWVNADGRYDLGPRSNLFGGLGYSQEHEDRGSPDAVAPTLSLAAIDAEPTVYRALTAQGGIVHRFGDNLLRAGATFERLDYDDVPSLAETPIDNDDRDRQVLGLALRLSHRVDERLDLFTQALWNGRRYRQTPDDYGYYRDSDGYRLAVGLKGRIARGLDAEGYVGFLSQDYDDPRFDRVSAPDFAGKLDWRVEPRTRARLTLERTLNETTLEGSSSYLYTSLTGSLNHQIDDRTTLAASLGAGLVGYQDVGRDDWIYTAGLTAGYRLADQLYVTAGYRFARRDSNDSGVPGEGLYDYERQQIFLTIRAFASP
jgi:hypothetical protein